MSGSREDLLLQRLSVAHSECEKLMKMGKKMTTNSHNKGSEKDHSRRKVKKEDAKANGIWKQLIDEEYERQKAEIIIHLEVLMELLQMKEEDKRCGFRMRRKIRWHRLQRRNEQMMNSRLKEELLRISEYQEEKLKNKTSSETKMYYGVKFDNLCMFAGGTCEEGQFVDIVTKEEEDMKNLNSVLKGGEISRSHIKVHTQLGRSVAFQHIVRGKSKESLA